MSDKKMYSIEDILDEWESDFKLLKKEVFESKDKSELKSLRWRVSNIEDLVGKGNLSSDHKARQEKLIHDLDECIHPCYGLGRFR